MRGTGDGETYRLRWRNLREDWPALLLLAASLAAGLILYPSLPPLVPSHWNIHGEVDRHSSRLWAALGLPAVTAALYALMLLTPLVDPRRSNYPRFAGAYRLIRLSLVAYLVGLHALLLLAATGRPVDVTAAVRVATSLLFVVLGNVLGQVRPNYFVGIRTPWTLASERVWVKTHRAAARAWVAGGLVELAGAAAEPVTGFAILLAALGGATLFSVIYSYAAFRREER